MPPSSERISEFGSHFLGCLKESFLRLKYILTNSILFISRIKQSFSHEATFRLISAYPEKI